ncbi:fumarylacetoacetate hydrolase family protein [Accumulibacter sp.]|uniref:fumarylacetoacetate hydrolase family protein n=1 Tax=Accumulibacter sp. TaxID=2053492 RepID=UPI0025DF8296|nr:fumarylacetoacetate hydrolase family protein [Accumulibacter sp.]MCM8596341.1 fumarylacetoacetate hydrolase family protein [Accumulibacter sp.]MCM8627475.1 fumarylacetoacetate hydrolase family protein [Accumulibacter sp.]MDS4050490.1 fumarylacetoacetate hydrolase family protein [Accumulibacter sp.]
MSYLFEPPPTVAVALAGSDALFPVRRVYCVGRNYADHAAEMGADTREPPFFFGKPADALVPGGGTVAYPPATANLQHEVELVVALAGGGREVPVARALDLVLGYAVGIDLTRRDLQQAAKEKGHPWDMAKGFDQSAPIGPIHPLSIAGHPTSGAIWLRVNGELRQNGDLRQMSWSVAEVIARLSGLVTLAPGDLIFTGTPAGVSTLARGDQIEAGVAGLGELIARIV